MRVSDKVKWGLDSTKLHDAGCLAFREMEFQSQISELINGPITKTMLEYPIIQSDRIVGFVDVLLESNGPVIIEVKTTLAVGETIRQLRMYEGGISLRDKRNAVLVLATTFDLHEWFVEQFAAEGILHLRIPSELLWRIQRLWPHEEGEGLDDAFKTPKPRGRIRWVGGST